jgi:outer membrane scaffolding protein for murein synthesis (MipA/OmpV family)
MPLPSPLTTRPFTTLLLCGALVHGMAVAQTTAATLGDTQAPEAAAGAATAPGAPRSPLWEAGFFAVGGSQQAYPGAKQQVRSAIALPFLVYRGQVLRAEQGTVGVRAARTQNIELDIGLSGSFGSAASDNDVRRGLPNIGTLVEFGPRLRWNLGPAPWGGGLSLALPARGVFDITDGMRFRGVAVEPVLGWGNRTAGGWGYGASLGLLLGSTRLNDTFYGVAPAYATATRPAYEARSGVIATRLAFNLSKRLSTDWRFFAYARVDTVEGAANRRSPLVDRPTGASAGLGLSWTWLRSDDAAQP